MYEVEIGDVKFLRHLGCLITLSRVEVLRLLILIPAEMGMAEQAQGMSILRSLGHTF